MYLKHIYVLIGILILFFSIQVIVIFAQTKSQTDNILNSAEELIDKKDYKNAEKAVKKALQIDSSSSRAYYLLGKIYQEGYKKYSDAIGAYKKAIKLNPSNSESHYNIGSCYYALNKKEAAIIWIDFSKQLLFEQKKYDKYKKTLQTLIKIVEDDELKKMYENELYRFTTYGVEPTAAPSPKIVATLTPAPALTPTGIIPVITVVPTNTPKPAPTIIQINLIPTSTPVVSPTAYPTSNIVFSSTPGPNGELPEDIISNGFVSKGIFYGSNNYKQVYAINQKGEKLWLYRGEDEFKSSPCVKDNSLYINCKSGDLYSINAGDGKLIWKFSAGEGLEEDSPLIDDKLLYIVRESYVYGINKEKGNPEWKVQIEGEASQCKLLTEEIIYLGTKENKLYAIGTSGKLLWKYGASGEILSPLSCSPNNLYGVTSDSSVFCLSKKNGKELWKFKTENEMIAGPLNFNDNVYVCDKNGNIYCISQNIGESIWTYNGDETFDEMSPFITAEGIIYTGTTEQNVLAINSKTGNLIWKFKCGGELKKTEFCQIKDNIIFIAEDNKLYGVNYSTGNLLWTFSPPTGELINKKPVIFGNNIYLISSEGTFYMISSETGSIDKISVFFICYRINIYICLLYTSEAETVLFD